MFHRRDFGDFFFSSWIFKKQEINQKKYFVHIKDVKFRHCLEPCPFVKGNDASNVSFITEICSWRLHSLQVALIQPCDLSWKYDKSQSKCRKWMTLVEFFLFMFHFYRFLEVEKQSTFDKQALIIRCFSSPFT